MAKRFLLAFSLVLVTVLVFHRAAHSWFIADDFYYLDDVVQRLLEPPLAILGREWWFRMCWRPLVRLSWMVNFSLGGFDFSGYFWFNILVHSANAVLVFALCSLLGLSLPWAWVAAFFFAVGPHKGRAVCWITGRTEGLGLLFVLLAIVLWAHGRKTENARLRYWSLLPLVVSFGVKEWCPFYGFLLLAMTDRYLSSRWNWRDLLLPFALCFGFLAVTAVALEGGRFLQVGWPTARLFLSGFAQTMLPGYDYARWLLAGQIISLIVYPLAIASGRLGRFAVGWVVVTLIGPSLLIYFPGALGEWKLYPAYVGAAIALVCASGMVLRFSNRLGRGARAFRLAAIAPLLLFGLVQVLLCQRAIAGQLFPQARRARRNVISAAERAVRGEEVLPTPVRRLCFMLTADLPARAFQEGASSRAESAR